MKKRSNQRPPRVMGSSTAQQRSASCPYTVSHLVGDVEHPAELSRVRHVHGPDAGDHADVNLLEQTSGARRSGVRHVWTLHHREASAEAGFARSLKLPGNERELCRARMTSLMWSLQLLLRRRVAANRTETRRCHLIPRTSINGNF